jgi:hypothetical protein
MRGRGSAFPQQLLRRNCREFGVKLYYDENQTGSKKLVY